jgi:ribosomal protein S18 acetylase RimI-like enzyme
MSDHPTFSIIPYAPEHSSAIHQILTNIGWEERYITGQLESLQAFTQDRDFSGVWVALVTGAVAGFVTVQLYAWNRLAQLHGLAVDPACQRMGIAAALVQQAENLARQRGWRGVYVDTPVTNTGARSFYAAQGYRQDYIMTAYYADDLDGVTYLKLFAV